LLTPTTIRTSATAFDSQPRVEGARCQQVGDSGIQVEAANEHPNEESHQRNRTGHKNRQENRDCL
jgi:hypothetical protein